MSALARRSRARAEALPPVAEVELPEEAALGYRGSWLRAPDGREWRAGSGVVIRDGDARADPLRAVEQAILATAPEGVLPHWAAPAG